MVDVPSLPKFPSSPRMPSLVPTNGESLDITDGLTVIAWVKGSGFVVSKGVYGVSSSNKAYDFDVYNGKVRVWLVKGGSNWILKSTTEIDTTKFNQIAFTFKSPKIRIYINGSLDSEITDSDVYINPNTLNLIIGRSHYATDFEYFNGIIDEVMIFNRALTPAEILRIYRERNSNYLVKGFPSSPVFP